MGLPIIGKMLGHSSPATTAKYAHLASDPVKAAAASVSGKIADAMRLPESTEGSSEPSADVIDIESKRQGGKRP